MTKYYKIISAAILFILLLSSHAAKADSLTIEPANIYLPAGMVGQPYTPITFVITGGWEPDTTYACMADYIVNGMGLDSDTCTLSGTPTSMWNGTLELTVTAMDKNGNGYYEQEKNYFADIVQGKLNLLPVAEPLPDGCVGQRYASPEFSATGSVDSQYLYKVDSILPTGIMLYQNGRTATIDGITAAGSYGLTMSVFASNDGEPDSDYLQSNRFYTFNIAPTCPGTPSDLSQEDLITIGVADIIISENEAAARFAHIQSDNIMGHIRDIKRQKTDQPKNINIWTEGSLAIGKSSNDLMFRTNGVTLGIDKKISQTMIIGIAGGFASDQTSASTGLVKTNNQLISLYSSISLENNMFFDGSVGFGTLNFDVQRLIDNDTSPSRTRHGQQIFTSLVAGREKNQQTLYGRLDFVHISLGDSAIDEIAYQQQSSQVWTGSTGWLQKYDFVLGYSILELESNMELDYNNIKSDDMVVSSVANASNIADLGDMDDSNIYGKLGLGLAIDFDNGFTTGLKYHLIEGFNSSYENRLSLELTLGM